MAESLYRGIGSRIIRNLTADPEDITEKGIYLRLTRETDGEIDRRLLRSRTFAKTDFQDTDLDGTKLKKYLKELEKRFAEDFYYGLISAYQTNSMAVAPLKKTTLTARRSMNITSTTHFIATGEFIENAIIYDRSNNSVRISNDMHSPKPMKEGSSSPRSYSDIFIMNEFGSPPHIPPRPVMRRLLKVMLKKYTTLVKRAVSRYVNLQDVRN